MYFSVFFGATISGSEQNQKSIEGAVSVSRNRYLGRLDKSGSVVSADCARIVVPSLLLGIECDFISTRVSQIEWLPLDFGARSIQVVRQSLGLAETTGCGSLSVAGAACRVKQKGARNRAAIAADSDTSQLWLSCGR